MYYTTLTLTLGEILSHRQPSEVTDTFLKGLNLKPSHLFKVYKLETQAPMGSNRPGRGRGGRGGRGGETARSPSPEAKRSRRQRGRSPSPPSRPSPAKQARRDDSADRREAEIRTLQQKLAKLQRAQRDVAEEKTSSDDDEREHRAHKARDIKKQLARKHAVVIDDDKPQEAAEVRKILKDYLDGKLKSAEHLQRALNNAFNGASGSGGGEWSDSLAQH